MHGARAWWARLRALPWWAQLALAVLAVGVLAGLQPTEGSDAEAGGQAVAATSTTAAPSTTTTAEPVTTTTTLIAAPEGGTRASAGDLASSTRTEDGVDRRTVGPDDLAALESLVVAAEASTGYERSRFPHWDDVDGDGCDTRCDVLSSQRLPGGGWYSEWDGATELDPSLVHVDHVVALAEAWRSGAHAWTPAQRDEFADDRRNLLAVTESANLRKRDADATSWFPSRSDANCLWARTVVAVKSAWSLSVDADEKRALGNLLASCGAVPPPAPTSAPPTTAATAPAGCTPGYDPCLPPADDYDCEGGRGNGPAYTGAVAVDHAHGDPYDLDGNGDGMGCE